MVRNPALGSFWDFTSRQRLLVMVAGAAAFGGVVYTVHRYLSRQRLRPLAPPACDEIRASSGTVAGIKYLERVSKGADPNKRLPMLVVFHSAVTKPESFAGWAQSLTAPARVIVPYGLERVGERYSWFKRGARTDDQDELADQMEEAGDRVAKFLADIVRCRPTAGRPVVTGSSQGGSMSYLMASRHPQFVRGAVAVAGWLPQRLWTEHMAETVGLHGMKDTTVPFDWTAQYAQVMQARGAPLTFRIYDTGHILSGDMVRDWRTAVNELMA